MSSLVPANQIEQLVGARRHPLYHFICGRSADGLAYILHPDECRAMWDDLRDCPWSLALDRRTYYLPPDEPFIVRYRQGELEVSGPVPADYQIEVGEHMSSTPQRRTLSKNHY